jgi:TfoX/Sxy family transcriptional regulator of competence genes
MAINEILTNRLRKSLTGYADITEKKMFRGISFIRNGKICMSAGDDEYLFRVDPDASGQLLTNEGCRPMVMKGRVMAGYIYVRADSILSEKKLKSWIRLALDYNKKLLQHQRRKTKNK